MSAQNPTLDLQIRDLYRLGVPKTRIAEQLGIHRNTVHARILQMEKAGGPTSTPATTDTTEDRGAVA